jgi:hypothetical protein
MRCAARRCSAEASSALPGSEVLYQYVTSAPLYSVRALRDSTWWFV